MLKLTVFVFAAFLLHNAPPPSSILSFFFFSHTTNPIPLTLSLSLFFCDSEKLRQFLWAYMSMCPKMCTYTWSSNEKIWKCLHKSGVWHAMQPVKPIAEFCLSLSLLFLLPLLTPVSPPSCFSPSTFPPWLSLAGPRVQRCASTRM